MIVIDGDNIFPIIVSFVFILYKYTQRVHLFIKCN